MAPLARSPRALAEDHTQFPPAVRNLRKRCANCGTETSHLPGSLIEPADSGVTWFSGPWGLRAIILRIALGVDFATDVKMLVSYGSPSKYFKIVVFVGTCKESSRLT